MSWRAELSVANSTGKERDTETGLDYFGARYYGSNMGRWMSPDWSESPEPVPYLDLSDPQTLNLYGYVRNNPTTLADADGHIAGVDDVVVAAAVGITVAALAFHYYLRQPETQRNLNNALSSAGAAIGSFLHSDQTKTQPYDVGTYGDLKGRSLPGDGTDIHHVPQAGQAGQVIPDYDKKTAPAIALPKDQHKDIPTERGEAKRNPRDQVAKDVKDLRKSTDAPRGQIQKLVDKIKKTYPDSMKKPDNK
jgi:RHS repeat-associated protein